MQSEKIVFIGQPGCVIACESCFSSLGHDPETNDLYEYAHIYMACSPANIDETEWNFTGDIKWTKHSNMLRPEHRQEIERMAAKMRDENKESIAKAKTIQERNIRM